MKPRSKSACGSNRPTVTFSTNELHQQQSTPKRQSPRIDRHSSDVISSQNKSNNSNALSSQLHSHSQPQFHRVQALQQRKLFLSTANTSTNDFDRNRPTLGKRSYTIINTELHTNEMWVHSTRKIFCFRFKNKTHSISSVASIFRITSVFVRHRQRRKRQQLYRNLRCTRVVCQSRKFQYHLMYHHVRQWMQKVQNKLRIIRKKTVFRHNGKYQRIRESEA